jgi:hypothetical protein
VVGQTEQARDQAQHFVRVSVTSESIDNGNNAGTAEAQRSWCILWSHVNPGYLHRIQNGRGTSLGQAKRTGKAGFSQHIFVTGAEIPISTVWVCEKIASPADPGFKLRFVCRYIFFSFRIRQSGEYRVCVRMSSNRYALFSRIPQLL